jgi:hypothetical protein
MPFTPTIYKKVPRKLFRLVHRGVISLQVRKEGRRSWDIQEEAGEVFLIAYWGSDFKGNCALFRLNPAFKKRLTTCRAECRFPVPPRLQNPEGRGGVLRQQRAGLGPPERYVT